MRGEDVLSMYYIAPASIGVQSWGVGVVPLAAVGSHLGGIIATLPRPSGLIRFAIVSHSSASRAHAHARAPECAPQSLPRSYIIEMNNLFIYRSICRVLTFRPTHA